MIDCGGDLLLRLYAVSRVGGRKGASQAGPGSCVSARTRVPAGSLGIQQPSALHRVGAPHSQDRSRSPAPQMDPGVTSAIARSECMDAAQSRRENAWKVSGHKPVKNRNCTTAANKLVVSFKLQVGADGLIFS